MKNCLTRGRNSPHLFEQKNWTVYSENKKHIGILEHSEPKTNVVEGGASFHFSCENGGPSEPENYSEPASSTRRVQEEAGSFRGEFEDENGMDHATITERSGAIHEQGSKAILDQRRIRNRIYFECLNVAEVVLTKYMSPGRKPMRFLKTFADELFEKRTTESTKAYSDFLEDKIWELQLRNGRLSRINLRDSH
jgi:hypothetical protein